MQNDHKLHEDKLREMLIKTPMDDGLAFGNFTQYHFLVVGLNGVGKSTTIYWLAEHMGLDSNTRERFTRAQAGVGVRSQTQNFMSVQLSDAVKFSDTKGLPDWDVRHMHLVKWLALGCKKEGTELQWTTELGYRDTWLPSLHNGCSYRDSWGFSTPKGRAHAVLLILRYIHSDGSRQEKNEIRNFISKLRAMMPDLEIVVAVTRLEKCASLPGQTEASCAEKFASDVGFPEHGSVFPLVAQDPKVGGRHGKEVYIAPAVLVPIIRRLKELAFRYMSNQVP